LYIAYLKDSQDGYLIYPAMPWSKKSGSSSSALHPLAESGPSNYIRKMFFLNKANFNNVLCLTASSSLGVKKNLRTNRRGTMPTTKNGNAKAADVDFTIHRIARPRAWLAVNKCIFHVRTLGEKSMVTGSLRVEQKPFFTLRQYATFGWYFTGISTKQSLS